MVHLKELPRVVSLLKYDSDEREWRFARPQAGSVGSLGTLVSQERLVLRLWIDSFRAGRKWEEWEGRRCIRISRMCARYRLRYSVRSYAYGSWRDWEGPLWAPAGDAALVRRAVC